MVDGIYQDGTRNRISKPRVDPRIDFMPARSLGISHLPSSLEHRALVLIFVREPRPKASVLEKSSLLGVFEPRAASHFHFQEGVGVINYSREARRNSTPSGSLLWGDLPKRNRFFKSKTQGDNFNKNTKSNRSFYVLSYL